MRKPTPAPIEGMKLMVDAVKWVAGVAMILVASATSVFSTGIDGGWRFSLVAGIISLLISACCAALLLFLAAMIVGADEDPESSLTPDDLGPLALKFLKWQSITFGIGIIGYALAVISKLMS